MLEVNIKEQLKQAKDLLQIGDYIIKRDEELDRFNSLVENKAEFECIDNSYRSLLLRQRELIDAEREFIKKNNINENQD